MKFETLYYQWWTVHKLSIKPVTEYSQNQLAVKHILPYFADRDVDGITDADIAKFIEHELASGNRLTHQPLCQNTVVRLSGIVKIVLGYAKTSGYIKTNPADAIRLKRVPARKYEIYTPEEVNALIESARPHWMGDIILLAYRTGMRRGEIYGLQWKDIDFSDNTVSINRTVECYAPKTKFVVTPKTKSSVRIIMLDNLTMQMLSCRNNKRTSDTWVFANKYGELMSPWYNVKYFRDACQKTGIKGKRFHDLRHTHITELVQSGISIPIVQQRAGHTNINTTMHYTHISYDMQQVVVNLLNKKLLKTEYI